MINKYTLERANDFIKNNNINKNFYPNFNFAAPIGWINDPNGIIIYNNELHLFYQHYPYDSIHGKMHWGHAKTKDGINWDHLNVALAPDQSYDKDGVFSGSAIEKDGKIYLVYTGHVINGDGKVRQNQSIAVSENGIDFEKYEGNPVIDEKDVPEGSSISDFRDPKVFERDDIYYMVIGSKTIDKKGQVLLYKSEDLLDWEYISVILPYNEFLGDMVECPDLLFFENKDVFLLNAMNYTDKETNRFYSHISWLIEGKVDWDSFTFEAESIRKMDGGFDFYAPQTTLISSESNEYVGIAWQQAWNKTLPSHDERHKWAGQMTIPRLLKMENNKIMQYPYPEIKSRISCVRTHEEIVLKDKREFQFNEEYIEFSMEQETQIELTLSNNNDKKLTIHFKSEEWTIKFSRKETHEIVDSNNNLCDQILYPISLKDNYWNIKIFIDTSSIQIFINNYYTLSSTFYSKEPMELLSFKSYKQTKLTNFKIGSIN